MQRFALWKAALDTSFLWRDDTLQYALQIFHFLSVFAEFGMLVVDTLQEKATFYTLVNYGIFMGMV